jgi:cell division GTPase FtsZ
MAEQITGSYDESQVAAFEQLQEEGKADSYAEAARMASYAGLREMGYINGESKHTALKSTVSKIGWVFTIAGLVGLAMTVAYPVPARVPSFAVLTFGVVMFPVHSALEKHEPKVSKRLKRLFGGSA